MFLIFIKQICICFVISMWLRQLQHSDWPLIILNVFLQVFWFFNMILKIQGFCSLFSLKLNVKNFFTSIKLLNRYCNTFLNRNELKMNEDTFARRVKYTWRVTFAQKFIFTTNKKNTDQGLGVTVVVKKKHIFEEIIS